MSRTNAFSWWSWWCWRWRRRRCAFSMYSVWPPSRGHSWASLRPWKTALSTDRVRRLASAPTRSRPWKFTRRPPPHRKRILSRSHRRLFTFQISSNSGPGCLGRMRGLSATDCDHFKVTSLHCPTHRLRLSFLKLGHSLPKRDFVGDTDHIFLFWGILDAENKEN